ncbi:MAG: hypothetical protein IJ196_02130 [Prevotella sp.]|nr:hypothetical protein [Prevotella sp.]
MKKAKTSRLEVLAFWYIMLTFMAEKEQLSRQEAVRLRPARGRFLPKKGCFRDAFRAVFTP